MTFNKKILTGSEFKVEDPEELDLANSKEQEVARMEKHNKQSSKKKAKYQQKYTIRNFVFKFWKKGSVIKITCLHGS